MRRALPRGWRRFAAVAAGIAIFVGVVALGITHLPVAPNVDPRYDAPDTAAGLAIRQVETLRSVGSTVSWAVVPGNPYWILERSTDGGAQWTDVTPEGAGTNGGLELSVQGPDSALIAYRAYEYDRDSAFATTSDGGLRWNAGILPDAIATGPDPMAESSDGELWAVLGSGEVVHSEGASGSWTQSQLPAVPSGSCLPNSIRLVGEQGWVTGSCRGTAGLWQTVDGGLSWQYLQLATSLWTSGPVTLLPPASSGAGPEELTAEVSGAKSNRIQLFQFSGHGWTSTPMLTLPAGRVLSSPYGQGEAWVLVAPDDPGATALLYQTSSAGAEWSFEATPIPAEQLTAVSMSSASAGSALSQAAHKTILWATSDSGRRWSSTAWKRIAGPTPLTNGVNGD